MVKNLPASIGDAKDEGSIPALGRFLETAWQPTPLFLTREFRGRGAWWSTSIELLRVEHNWSGLAHALPLKSLSHLPPHSTPLGCHRTLALGSLHHTANSHWLFYICMYLLIFPNIVIDTKKFFQFYFPWQKTESKNDRGWDGWMASLTQWTWVLVNSGSWWWAGRPGVLQSMGLQRVGHDWANELTDKSMSSLFTSSWSPFALTSTSFLAFPMLDTPFLGYLVFLSWFNLLW